MAAIPNINALQRFVSNPAGYGAEQLLGGVKRAFSGIFKQAPAAPATAPAPAQQQAAAPAPAASAYRPAIPVVAPASPAASPGTVQTPSGTYVNPATGGVVTPPPVNPTFSSEQNVPTFTFGGSPVVPNVSAVSTPATPFLPPATAAPAATPAVPTTEESAYEAASKAYLGNVAPTAEEERIQQDLARLGESSRAAYLGEGDRPIPLEFITGRQQSLEQRALALAKPLEARAALLEARRTGALAASQFGLEQAGKRLDEAKATAKAAAAPVSLSPGETVGRINPATGKFEPSYTAPARAETPSISERYGTGIIGEYNFYAEQEQAAGREPIGFDEYQTQDANRKATAAGGGQDPNRILTATEATALGVPFGTTASAAYGITPERPLTQSQSQAATFSARLDQSTKTINDLGAQFTSMTAKLPGVPEALKSEDRKLFEQAERNYITAVLRRESGAAIAPSEFAEARLNYIPQAGDPKSVLEQKKKTREIIETGMRREAAGAAFGVPQGGGQAPTQQSSGFGW